MNPTDALTRLEEARSGHLATARPDGRPHLVVVTFAVSNGQIVTAIDHKPKTTQNLQRLTNIAQNPAVSFMVDHYENDWRLLWWVRVDGVATVVEPSRTRFDPAVDALVAKYSQYQEQRPSGPVISVTMDKVTGWASTP